MLASPRLSSCGISSPITPACDGSACAPWPHCRAPQPSQRWANPCSLSTGLTGAGSGAADGLWLMCLTPLASSPALCSDGGPAELGDTVHCPASALGEQGRGWLWAGRSSQAPMEASSMAVILRAGCCTRGPPCHRTEIPFGAGISLPPLLPGPAPLSVAVPSALGMLVGVPHGLVFPPPPRQDHGAFPHCSAALPPISAGGFN